MPVTMDPSAPLLPAPRGGTDLVIVAGLLGHARLDTTRISAINYQRRRPGQSARPAPCRRLTPPQRPSYQPCSGFPAYVGRTR